MVIARAMSILVGAGLLIQIWFVLVITNVLPGLLGTYSRSFAETLYGPTIPHLILLLAALVAVVLHAKHRSLDAFAFPILCLLLSFLTWCSELPAGEEGTMVREWHGLLFLAGRHY